MKRTISALVLLLLFVFGSGAAMAAGFSGDPAAMNQAAQSVLKLEAYRSDELFATGSGFIAINSNILITNYHVIQGADKMIAYTDSGEPYTITQLLTADAKQDIAILFINSNLAPLALADHDPERGGRCIAIGSPRGFKNSFSEGMISGTVEDEGVNYVQFTAPISSGSSGGALFNDGGEVIGITTMALVGSSSTVSQNMNFAVDIRQAAALYSAHCWDAPTELKNSAKIADSSYRNDYRQGDRITIGSLVVRVPGNFTVETTDTEIMMTRGDTEISIAYLSESDLGDLGSAAFGLLSRIWSKTDMALKAFTVLEFREEFEMSSFTHPVIPCGAECAVTPGRRFELDGMERNAAMAVVTRNDDYIRVMATSISGSTAGIEADLLAALDCFELP